MRLTEVAFWDDKIGGSLIKLTAATATKARLRNACILALLSFVA
jgi:hypothetical protein